MLERREHEGQAEVMMELGRFTVMVGLVWY